MGGPCSFSVSPWPKSFFFLFWGTFIQLGVLLGQGLGLGPGLDNFASSWLGSMVSLILIFFPPFPGKHTRGI